MATNLGLPEGFELDKSAGDMNLPEGFVLDSAPQISAEETARQENVVNNANGFDRFMFGVLNGLMDVGKGAGIFKDLTPEEQAVIQSVQQKLTAKPSTSQDIGEFVGQAAPFLGTGGLIAQAPRGAARLATAAGLGAAEGGIVANGTGSDVVVGATIGGVVGPLAEVAAPVINKAASSIVSKIRGKNTNPIPGGISQETNAAEDTLRNLAVKRPELASSLQGLDPKLNQDALDAAKRLGIDELLLPSHLSGNEQYRAVEQAIKSRTGSALKVQEDEAIQALARSAGQIIDDVAKMPDALAMSEKFVGLMDNRMAGLERRSNQLYARVDNAMPPGTKVEAQNTARHLEKEADELGGWGNLGTVEHKVFKAINPGAEGILTYANLNKQRRLVGDALYKNKGPYKDADDYQLSKLYANLSEDQRTVLGTLDRRRDFEVAQRLVNMRKSLERQDVALRGKNLTGDVTTRATAALQSMSKGDGRAFRELMQNIPSRQMRYEIAATSIRDMLSNGKRGSDFNPAGFADWWQNMSASGQLRQLSKHVPLKLMTGLADVYTVAREIQMAKRHELGTGKLVEFTERFNRVTASHEMAAKYAQRIGTMAGANLGPLGALGGAAIGEKIAAKARVAGGAGSADAAEKMIISPEFQTAFKSIKQGSKTAAADVDSAVRKSNGWGEFYNSLPDIDKRTISRIGIIGWLSNEESDQ